MVPVGVCSQAPTYHLNAYGIVVLVTGSLAYLVTQKRHPLEYLSTLQNMAFLSLLEIKLPEPSLIPATRFEVSIYLLDQFLHNKTPHHDPKF